MKKRMIENFKTKHNKKNIKSKLKISNLHLFHLHLL